MNDDFAKALATVKEALRHLEENSTAGILRKESALRAVTRLEGKSIAPGPRSTGRRAASSTSRGGAADSILRAVDEGGAIQHDTLAELIMLLSTKTNYHVHVEVAVLPTGSAILKTIDNERDAQETIRRLRAKP